MCRVFFIIVTFCAAYGAIIRPDGKHMTSPFTGTTFWQNQLGSNATFIIKSRFLQGYYTTAVDIDQPPKSPLPLVGQLTDWKPGQLVTWSVNFDTSPPSMTTWVGYCDPRSALLHTHWMLMEQTGAWWNTTLMGDDTFRKLGPEETIFRINPSAPVYPQ
jgi:hypothetical protein